MVVVKNLLPASFREAAFMFMTFCNVGITSFLAKAGYIPEAVFSGVTSLLCFSVWVHIVNKK